MIKTSIELQPFSTPNFVSIKPFHVGQKQDGFAESPKYPLSDLDPETLSDLCDQFRKDIFSKAQKIDPKTIKARK